MRGSEGSAWACAACLSKGCFGAHLLWSKQLGTAMQTAPGDLAYRGKAEVGQPEGVGDCCSLLLAGNITCV